MLIDQDPGEGTAYIDLAPEINNRWSGPIFEGKFGTVILNEDGDGNIVGIEVIA